MEGERDGHNGERGEKEAGAPAGTSGTFGIAKNI